MKPLMLTMEKFGSYNKKCVIDFERLCDRGIFLINGQTGSGKTTVFDGVCAALFGCASGDKRDKYDLISDYDNAAEKGKPKKGSVELIFVFHGKKYRIKRVFKKSEGKSNIPNECCLFEYTGSGEKEIVLKSEKAYDRYIENLLGIGIEQFRKAAMLAQGSFRDLIDSNDGDIEKILRNIFKTDKYDDFRRRIAEKGKNLKDLYKDAENRIESAFTGVCLDDADSVRFKSAVLYNDKLAVLNDYVEKCEARLRDEKSVLEALEKSIYDINNKKTLAQSINADFDRYSDLKAKMTAIAENGNIIDALKKDLDTADRAEKTLVYVNNAKKAADNLAAAKKRLNDNTAEKMLRESDRERLKKHYEDVQPMTAEAERLKTEADNIKRIMPLFKEINSLNAEYAECTEKINKTNDIISRLKLENEELLGEQKKLNEQNDALSDTAVEKVKTSEEIKKLKSRNEALGNIKKQYREYKAAAEKYNKSIDDYKHKKEIFQDVNERYNAAERAFFDNQAGIIAQRLEQGKPCPVCGTYGINELRKPAKTNADAPSKRELEKMKNDVERERDELGKKSENASNANLLAQTALDNLERNALSAELEYDSTEEIENSAESIIAENNVKISNLENAIAELDKNEKTLKSNRLELLKLDKRLETNTDGINEYADLLNKYKIEQGKISARTDSIKNELPDYGDEETAEARLSYLKKQIDDKIKEVETAKTAYQGCLSDIVTIDKFTATYNDNVTSAAADVQRENEILEDVLSQNGFADIDEVVSIDFKKIKDGGRALEKVNRYTEFSIKLEQAGKNIEGKQRQDTALFDDELNKLREKSSHQNDVINGLVGILHTNRKIIDIVEKEISGSTKIRDEFEGVQRLINLNCKDFERYVQSYYLDRILVAANRRLARMTDGNFILHRPYDDAGKLNNVLSLWVHDRMTGTDRPASTLSGGESFKAALALALGMSDEIQNTKSGIEINTVFIDEGFGSLDDESREQAVRVLMDMADSDNRLVGVISHVSELKKMIERRIDVVKGIDGSYVKQF